MSEDETVDDEMLDKVGEVDLDDDLDLEDDFAEKDALDLQFGGQAEVE